jgi:hypothetical protein
MRELVSSSTGTSQVHRWKYFEDALLCTCDNVNDGLVGGLPDDQA